MAAPGKTGLISFMALIFFLLILLNSCDFISKNDDSESDTVWTFIFYEAADFANSYKPFNDFSSRMYSGKNLNVVVFRDTDADSASIWYIDEKKEKILLDEPGEVNMASAGVLQGFIDSCKSWYPADHYILAMYGHGYGWPGLCCDESNGWDYVTTKELNQALSNSSGVDIIMYTSPCNMASLEHYVQIRNNVDFCIGSENESGYGFWRNAMTDLRKLLHEDPNISCEEFSELTVDYIYNTVSDTVFEYQKELTMSAVSTQDMWKLMKAVDNMASKYRLDINRFVTLADSVYPDLQLFCGNSLVDLKSFCQCLKSVEDDTSYSNLIDSVLCYQEKSLINECHWNTFGDLGGMHLFYPAMQYNFNYSYKDSDELYFTKNTVWDNLMSLYYLRSKYK